MGGSIDDVRVVMDLERFGELTTYIAHKFARMREIDPPDFDSGEVRTLAIAAWEYFVFMSDRVEFARSVERDIAALSQEGDPS